LRPVVALYGVLTAGLLLVVWGLLRVTLRIRHINRPSDFMTRPTVECVWHEALVPYFVAAMPYAKPHAWLNHPAAYMKGVHYFLRVMGVRILVLGSSGHDGRKALDALVPVLRSGLSTFLNPDGPRGPAHELRAGVLDLSQETGFPVVPLYVRCSAAWRLPTWDRKLLPKPFSSLDLVYGPPVVVTRENRDAVRIAIRRHLDVGTRAERQHR